MDDLIGEFITETSDALADLDSELVKLEQNPNDHAILDSIFRLVHTTKGTCGFLGLARLESIAHAGENALRKIRDGAIVATPEAIALVFETLGCIKDLIRSLAENGKEPEGDDGDLKERLKAFVDTNGASIAPAITPEVPPAAKEAIFEEIPHYEEPHHIFAEVTTEPEVTAAPIKKTKEKAKQQLNAETKNGAITPSIHFDIGVIENVTQMIGELVITRNQLVHIASQREDAKMKTLLNQLSHISTELQHGVAKVCMQSLGHVGPNFPCSLDSAIVSVVMIESGHQKFAIPQANIVEFVRIDGESGYRVDTINESQVLRLRDRLVPLISLHEILDLSVRGGMTGSYVAVLRVGADDFGVIIDRVHDTQELVVKPLSRVLNQLDVYAGSAVLGDGSVTMVLNPVGLGRAVGDIDLADNGTDRATHQENATEFLVFHAGTGAPKAVPLKLVSRLERIDAAMIDDTGENRVIAYRDSQLRMVTLPGMNLPRTGTCEVIVLDDEGKTVGLAVEKIIDIQAAPLAIKIAGNAEQYLGSIALDGKTTDIVDADYFLKNDTDLLDGEAA